MSDKSLVEFLGGIDLFGGLSHRVLERVADQGTMREFAPGAVLVAEGEAVSGFHAFNPRGAELSVLRTGSAEVRIGGTVVTTVGPGDYVGELSLVDGGPRTAEVTAGPDGVTAFALSKWAFEQLLDSHPEVAVPMLRVVVSRLREAERS